MGDKLGYEREMEEQKAGWAQNTDDAKKSKKGEIARALSAAHGGPVVVGSRKDARDFYGGLRLISGGFAEEDGVWEDSKHNVRWQGKQYTIERDDHDVLPKVMTRAALWGRYNKLANDYEYLYDELMEGGGRNRSKARRSKARRSKARRSKAHRN